ncbi:hypothetical protein EDC01DRAFT_622114, partial [Geopyxis carbonaria]
MKTKDVTKFLSTNDPWNIKPPLWDTIGEAFVNSAYTFPAVFGEPLRNFKRHCHELKAAEWKTVAKIAAPIFLQSLLPAEDYSAYITLVKAVMILEQLTLTSSDIAEAETKLSAFSVYYETRMYQRQWKNLRFCLPVFHQMLHCIDAIKWIGPMHIYTQWVMERV